MCERQTDRPAGAERVKDHQSESPTLCSPYSQRPPESDIDSKETNTRQ